MAERTDYILGTNPEELERLGFQHRVWSKDAFALWERPGLGKGLHVLDLGCGPGFASFDLSTIAGPNGRIVGLDQSPGYISYARSHAEALKLRNVEFVQGSFDDMPFEPGSFDIVYARWALAWISNVVEVVERVARILKPGGLFLSQEYLRWETFRIVPERVQVNRVIDACRESWRAMTSDIDIGPALPALLRRNGFTVLHSAPIAKFARPGQMVWQWPATFLRLYSLKLIEMDLLTEAEREAFLACWKEVEADPDSMLIAPLMMELVGRKS